MDCPLEELENWLAYEKTNGNIFPQGAVLCTVAKDGSPRSRVVGTMLDEDKIPKFHTSPASRKVEDIEFSNKASLTYSFQNTLRSVSVEGFLSSLSDIELDRDWLKFDEDFRKHYIVFGDYSGDEIITIDYLRKKRDELHEGAVRIRPSSFIGYKFFRLERISFYTVKEGDFAISTRFEKNPGSDKWQKATVVP